MTENLNAVFVYGTLRNSRVATHNIYDHVMYDYHGKFPFIVRASTTDAQVVRVKGNVIYVTDDELEQLDKYEGVDKGLYTREEVCAYSIDGNPHLDVTDCYVYVATDLLRPKPVTTGDWFNR